MELPDTGFGPSWESLYEKRMTKVIATRTGVSRREAKPMARDFIADMREVASIRLRR